MRREQAKSDVVFYGMHSPQQRDKFLEQLIDKIYNDHEAQLKDKDEEVKKAYMIGYRNGYSDAYDASEMCKLGFSKPFDRIDKKARSIVAMLFWEWKKSEREAEIERYDDWENGVSFGEDKKAEELFKEAYKMLKDNA